MKVSLERMLVDIFKIAATEVSIFKLCLFLLAGLLFFQQSVLTICESSEGQNHVNVNNVCYNFFF